MWFIVVHADHTYVHDYQTADRDAAFAVARELCRDFHCRVVGHLYHDGEIISTFRFVHSSLV